MMLGLDFLESDVYSVVDEAGPEAREGSLEGESWVLKGVRMTQEWASKSATHLTRSQMM